MKLWLKASLIAILLVTAATGVCSLMLLLRSGQSNLDLAIDNALTEQRMRAASWSAAMANSAGAQYGAVAQRSLARYLIGQFADENTILVSGDDFIYNSTAIDPAKYLPIPQNEQRYVIEDVGSGTLLLAGSSLAVGGTPYTLYVAKDITSVYTGVGELARQFAFINLGVVVLTGLLVVALVRLVLRPIAVLRQNAGLIAAGVYDRRIAAMERDEIGELAEHFNSMAEAVERRVRELQEEAERRTLFMSALSHELKTPMTSISGNAQTLLRTKMDADEQADALTRIDEECTRVERLSQKLMELIVLKRQDGLALERRSVAELLETVRLSCGEQTRQRELKLTVVNHMDTLAMDGDLLASLLLNLIDNAGKSSVPGDAIELVAEGGAISVIDHGKGIPPGELGRITQPFYMVDKSRSRKVSGVGLGLALAEEIARLHGARLEFQSVPGEGTTVKVVFAHAQDQ